MTFMDSISTCFNKYISFKGRAQRSEFWWFVLFIVIGSAIAGVFDSAMFETRTLMIGGMAVSYNAGWIGTVFSLAVFLPTWGVEVRRLHDIGKSGWWLLLGLIPVIGFIILLVWFIQTGTEGDNDYGPDPLA
ncbi:MAG: DUF805 domain-containing protein [Alphaproteobacteria bacterium]